MGSCGERLVRYSPSGTRQAVRDGADYLGLGAVFPTSTKGDADQMPHDTLRAICDAVDVPIVAIGGINRDNLLQLSGSGVDGVALVSAIFSAASSSRSVPQSGSKALSSILRWARCCSRGQALSPD